MGDEGKNVVDTIAILAEAVRKPADQDLSQARVPPF